MKLQALGIETCSTFSVIRFHLSQKVMCKTSLQGEKSLEPRYYRGPPPKLVQPLKACQPMPQQKNAHKRDPRVGEKPFGQRVTDKNGKR